MKETFPLDPLLRFIPTLYRNVIDSHGRQLSIVSNEELAAATLLQWCVQQFDEIVHAGVSDIKVIIDPEASVGEAEPLLLSSAALHVCILESAVLILDTETHELLAFLPPTSAIETLAQSLFPALIKHISLPAFLELQTRDIDCIAP